MEGYAQSREQELLTILDNLEKSYTPTSPAYKFSHVFYNIVDGPFERPQNFPPHLWNQSLLPDKSLMPVILNKAQIDERKVLQNTLAAKINDSRGSILKKVDSLKTKRAMLRNRLEVLCQKYRRVCKQYLLGEANDEACKIGIDMFSREAYVVRHSRPELLACMAAMKDRLAELDAGVSEALRAIERRNISEYQLDRF